MTIDNKWYDDLGERWWDQNGAVGPLHDMNPARFDYFHGVVGNLAGLAVLDVGCGGGILADCFVRSGALVTGLDRSHSSLKAAKRQLGMSEALWVNGGGDRLPFQRGRFDVVVAADFLEHVTNLQGVIGECARVLKPGGYFLYDTVNRTWQSRLVGIWLLERVLRIIPRNTHDADLFIKPAELCAIMKVSGLDPGEIKGLSPQAGIGRLLRSLLFDCRVGPFTITDSTAVSYIGYAVRRKSG